MKIYEELNLERAEVSKGKIQDICDFINKNRLATLKYLPEPVSVYEFIQKEFEKGDITQNLVFQFIFRSYYRMDNAGLSPEFKIKFFQILESSRSAEHINIQYIDKELRKESIRLIDRKRTKEEEQPKESLQFSFLTKMLSVLCPDCPVYDAEVARMFSFSRPDYKAKREERLTEYIEQHIEIIGTYQYILNNGLLIEIMDLFKERFSGTTISQVKMLDFIFWQAGKQKALLRKKKTKLKLRNAE